MCVLLSYCPRCWILLHVTWLRLSSPVRWPRAWDPVRARLLCTGDTSVLSKRGSRSRGEACAWLQCGVYCQTFNICVSLYPSSCCWLLWSQWTARSESVSVGRWQEPDHVSIPEVTLVLGAKMQKGVRLNDGHITYLALLAKKDGTRRGSLSKKSSDNTKWHSKSFALLQNMLFYFENDSSSRPSGLYLLEGCACDRAPSPKPPLSAKECLEKQVRSWAHRGPGCRCNPPSLTLSISNIGQRRFSVSIIRFCRTQFLFYPHLLRKQCPGNVHLTLTIT